MPPAIPKFREPVQQQDQRCALCPSGGEVHPQTVYEQKLRLKIGRAENFGQGLIPSYDCVAMNNHCENDYCENDHCEL
jgi:hypothetical protein